MHIFILSMETGLSKWCWPRSNCLGAVWLEFSWFVIWSHFRTPHELVKWTCSKFCVCKELSIFSFAWHSMSKSTNICSQNGSSLIYNQDFSLVHEHFCMLNWNISSQHFTKFLFSQKIRLNISCEWSPDLLRRQITWNVSPLFWEKEEEKQT